MQQRNEKNDDPGRQIQIECKWIYRRNSWPWNFDIFPIEYTLNMRPREVSEGKFVVIHEQRGHEEKDDDATEKVMLVNHFTWKELSERLHIDLGRAKDKMLEAGPDLEMSMIFAKTYKRYRSMLLYDGKRRQALYKWLLVRFLH